MQITTERLILREFKEDDWQAVLAYQSDPRYLRYYEWTERSPEAVQAFVRMFLDQQQARPRTKFQLAVTLKHSNQLIGNCGIRMETAGATEADIGYELASSYWGNGYATEAARAMIAFGFTELRVHRIWAHVVADNAGSARVLEKVGMRLEGQFREKEFYKGQWWDTLQFAILDYEWRAEQ
jgi:RimJ/RimL family protein N-acetyltransferase